MRDNHSESRSWWPARLTRNQSPHGKTPVPAKSRTQNMPAEKERGSSFQPHAVWGSCKTTTILPIPFDAQTIPVPESLARRLSGLPSTIRSRTESPLRQRVVRSTARASARSLPVQPPLPILASIFFGLASNSMCWRSQNEPADLQSQRELLPLVVSRADLDCLQPSRA